MSGRRNRDDEPCPMCGEPYDAEWYDDATVSPVFDISGATALEIHYAPGDDEWAADGYLHWGDRE